MNRLWVRLTLAFFLVTLVSVLAVAALANNRVSADFRHYYLQSQVQQSGLLPALAAYYEKNGKWDGVASVFADEWNSEVGPGKA
jgi:hypothetical protein